MKPVIIKRSALLLALVCVLALLGAPRASAANQVADIQIKAVLQDDGSADITQTWTATTDEGTEFYLACRDNGYLSITDFTVSDERGTYEPLASWDVGADFTQKARKCGVVETGEGVELCWGISEYGTHTYTLRYTLHGLVGAYDDADGFNYRFIDEMGTFPTDVELTLTKADGTPLTDADCDIWAFGYQGQIQFVDDTIRAWTESPLEDSQNMTVMVALNKGVLHPERTEEGSFETVKERAFDGSDYEDEPLTAKDIFYAILGVVFLCAVVAAVILIARRIHKAKLARLVKQAPYFRDAPNGGNLNVTHRLGVCSKQCEESSILGAYLLRLISDGCLEPVQQGLAAKAKDTSLRLVRPPAGSAGYEDALYTILEAAAGADGILQPRELALFCQRNYVPLSRFLASCKKDAMQVLVQEGCLKGVGCDSIRSLTAQGKQALSEVLGLKHFLLDFSLIRERALQETLIWQDYMVYALLLGIADKVAPQLRRLYPDLQPEIDQYARQATWAGYYNHVMYNAYERERQRREEARSGGSGGSASFGGGGFSGGGGGGTR